MKVTIEIPEDIGAVLKGEWNDVPRHVLEAIAVEGYRTGVLSENPSEGAPGAAELHANRL